MFLHYILMLLAMSFNIIIIICLGIGHGLGYVAYRYWAPQAVAALGIGQVRGGKGRGRLVMEIYHICNIPPQ